MHSTASRQRISAAVWSTRKSPLDRVVGVVLPGVVLQVGERAAIPLGGPGVRPGRVELADDGRTDVPTRLQGGHHTCAHRRSTMMQSNL